MKSTPEAAQNAESSKTLGKTTGKSFRGWLKTHRDSTRGFKAFYNEEAFLYLGRAQLRKA